MAASPRRLEGKVAIITGGASGLGEAAARLFVENGAFVLIVDIQDELGLRVVKDLGAEAAEYKHCDITMEAEVKEAVAFAVKKWGKLDVMLSNAGSVGKGGEGMSVNDLDMEMFDRVMAVNVRGTALAVKYAAKAMVDSNRQKCGGSIICTASVVSIMGGIAPLYYIASKHAVVGIMRAAARDLGKHGIRINCVSPAPVVTPLWANFFRDMIGDPDMPISQIQTITDSANVLAHHSLTPRDIANAALYLASNESAFVSGLNLVVDGAMSAVLSHPVNS